MGYALAEAAVARGWEVDLVSGPVALTSPAGARLVRVLSADEMYRACAARFEACDVFIAVAAVADYRAANPQPHKIKKQDGSLTIELVPTIDILKTLGAQKRPGQLVVGFAAETQDLEAYARRKLVEKNCDWIVANDVGAAGIGMEADDNAVTMLAQDGRRISFGRAPKREVADWVLRMLVT